MWTHGNMASNWLALSIIFCMLQTVFSFCPLNHHAPIPSQGASSCVGARASKNFTIADMYKKTSWKWKELVLRYYSSSLCLFPFRFTRRWDCARRRRNEFYFPEKNIFKSTLSRVLRKERTSWSRQRVLFVVGSDEEKKNETSCLWKRDSWEFYFNATPKKKFSFYKDSCTFYLYSIHTYSICREENISGLPTYIRQPRFSVSRWKKKNIRWQIKQSFVDRIGMMEERSVRRQRSSGFLGKTFLRHLQTPSGKTFGWKAVFAVIPAARKFKGVRGVQRPQRWQKFRRLGRKKRIKRRKQRETVVLRRRSGNKKKFSLSI